MKRDFHEWLSTMRNSINAYSYYVDFKKVYRNVDEIKLPLCLLNSLVGSRDIEQEFLETVKQYPQILECIPILLAIRQKEIYAQDEEDACMYNFADLSAHTPEEYAVFMRKVGLFDLLSRRIIANLLDYVTGIEVGLDSNARKNRGGHQMEDLVESYIRKTGAAYFKEMYLTDVESRWGVNLSCLSAEGKSTKRWDFVIYSHPDIYLVETNFYTSGGSKLNETARSYKMLAQEARDIPNVHFMWITDGAGWYSARRNLEETFDEMEHLYNINDLEHGKLLDLLPFRERYVDSESGVQEAADGSDSGMPFALNGVIMS